MRKFQQITKLGALLIFILQPACNLKTSVTSLASLKPDDPECIIKNDTITNAPCVLSDSSGKYLSEQKYSGRDVDLTDSTVQGTTSITYNTDGGIDQVQVKSTMPTGWSDNQLKISLDRSLTQQGGTYNPDYLASNIASGVDIFGLVGTFVVTQKPYCSNINTSSPTSTVAGIDAPADPTQRSCLAPAGAFIYSTPFNGRSANCDVTGGVNSISCFIKQYSQDLYLTNASDIPYACTYGNGYFYNNSWTSADFGKLKSPTIGGIVRNYCQVSNSQYFYPSAFGGRGQVCGTIASPPCWLDIPPNQTRTVSSSATTTTPICLEDQNDNLPSNWTGPSDVPLSKNTTQCLTAGVNRYVYTTAYDGRFRICNSDSLGDCYMQYSDITSGFNYYFTTSDNASCRSTLNTCTQSCETSLASCSGDTNACFATYAACKNNCYAHPTSGYAKCMTTVCTSTKNSCLTSCNSLSGTAKTNCQNTCNNNYNNCVYVENPKAGIWYLDPSLKLTNPTTKTLLIPNGAARSAAIPISQLFNTNAIKAGIGVFGITGSFGGQGVWSSGMARSMSVPQLTLNEENNMYSGSSDTALPQSFPSYTDTLKPYREVPSIMQDDEGSLTSTNIVTSPNRSTWGTTTCGIGVTYNTIDKKITDCNLKFGSDSVWDGATSGNAGQGRWTLITRNLDAASNSMVEVWRDERTNLLWSSLISQNTNWCKASGSSNNPGVNARFQEADPSGICNNAANQNQTGSVISACMFDTGFTDVDPSFTANGKVDLNTASTPAVHWRIPTLYDYEIAEYNGIRFVMPDMGTQRTVPLVEWTGTINSMNRAEAWAINSTDGSTRSVNRSDTAGVRCIGR